MPTACYLIFARKEYQQPLEHIGTLAIEEGPTARAGQAAIAELNRCARDQFGAEGWVEMIAIPEKSAVRVIPMG